MNPIEMFTYDMGSKIKIKFVIFEVFPNHGGNEMKYALLPFCPLYLFRQYSINGARKLSLFI